MTPLQHAAISLADAVLAALQFVPPCQVHWLADKANTALDAAGLPELMIGDEEVARRKRLAEFRRAGAQSLRRTPSAPRAFREQLKASVALERDAARKVIDFERHK